MPEASTPPFVDTNVLVRYLTDDPPDLAHRAATILESAPALTVSELVLAETAYVLTSVYRVPRAEVVDALTALVQRRNLTLLTVSKPLALEALRLCRDSNRVSFADALVWAQARESGVSTVFTFDDRFPADGLVLVGLEALGRAE